MKIESHHTDEAILQELGTRLTAERLRQNLTQAALAEEAGVSKRTVERLESGKVAAQLSGFIRVCRALGLVERFEMLVPQPTISPMTQLKLRGRQRQRASGTRALDTRASGTRAPGTRALDVRDPGTRTPSARVAEGTPKKWTWGESE